MGPLLEALQDPESGLLKSGFIARSCGRLCIASCTRQSCVCVCVLSCTAPWHTMQCVTGLCCVRAQLYVCSSCWSNLQMRADCAAGTCSTRSRPRTRSCRARTTAGRRPRRCRGAPSSTPRAATSGCDSSLTNARRCIMICSMACRSRWRKPRMCGCMGQVNRQ